MSGKLILSLNVGECGDIENAPYLNDQHFGFVEITIICSPHAPNSVQNGAIENTSMDVKYVLSCVRMPVSILYTVCPQLG